MAGFFKPGKSQNHLRGQGGKRAGAGRKTNKYKAALEVAEQIVKERLASNVGKAVDSYIKMSVTRKVKVLNGKGKLVTVDREADRTVTMHYVDKFMPSKQAVDVNLSGSVVVNTNVNPDMGPPPKKK